MFYRSLLSYKTVQSCTRLPVFWRNLHLRSSGYPADIGSMFSTRYFACISCFIQVSTLFILILHNNVVCIRHAVAYKIKWDGKFTVNFERVRNWQHALIIKLTRCINFSTFIFRIKLYMFRTDSLSIIRSFTLYTQHWYVSNRLCWLLASGIRMEHPDPASKQYDIYRCCVYNAKLLMMDRETVRNM